ncbi:MAG: hypothetical protein J0H55_14265 [Chitinophagaceae bacterium]|nr:hypothetical protein [Chitinophagaceae bacterium]
MELYADGTKGQAPVREEMQRDDNRANDGEYVYKAQIESARSVGDYTPRVIPRYEGISVPLENNLILWQR